MAHEPNYFGTRITSDCPYISHCFSSEQLKVTQTNKKDPGSSHHDITEIKWVGASLQAKHENVHRAVTKSMKYFLLDGRSVFPAGFYEHRYARDMKKN